MSHCHRPCGVCGVSNMSICDEHPYTMVYGCHIKGPLQQHKSSSLPILYKAFNFGNNMMFNTC